MAEEEAPKTVTKYYAYCPYGQECSKGCATLGGFFSEARARLAIENHLSGSPYHKLSEDSAALEAQAAQLKEEEVPEDDDDWDTRSSRSAPAEPKGEPPSKRRRHHRALLPSTASGSASRPEPPTAPPPGQGTGVVANLDHAFARQTRSAMAFTKAMPRTKTTQTKHNERQTTQRVTYNTLQKNTNLNDKHI